MIFHWQIQIQIILFILTSKFSQIHSIKCIEILHPKTRIFESLISYQSNKVPFDPEKSYTGNYVAFSLKQIDILPTNVFITFDSEHIIKLDLNGKSIKKISDGSFTSLTCLKYLTMRKNSLSNLTWKTFDGLENLKELELNGNELKELPDLVFKNFIRLKYLDLSDNHIMKLNILTFTNLTNLENLNLSHNNLIHIDKEVFNPLIELKMLDLSFNKFSESESHQWLLPSLENLSFSGNFLRSFDTVYNYSFVNLRNLNLSSNYLTELNVHGLKKSFRSLTAIDLNQNNWECYDLVKILHYLADLRLQIPSRNKTESNILGIDCYNDTSEISHFLLEITTNPSISTNKVTTAIIKLSPTNKSTDLKIDRKIEKLTVRNNEILVEISGIRKLLIFSLLFFVILVIVFASLQAGLCDSIKRKFYRREGYLDTNIQDNYVMFRS